METTRRETMKIMGAAAAAMAAPAAAQAAMQAQGKPRFRDDSAMCPPRAVLGPP
jgi:hypothetical protein